MLAKRNNFNGLWNTPFGVFSKELDNVLNQLWREEEGDGEAIGLYPVDVHEDATGFYIDAELPGFTKDQVEVSLEDGVLTIHAERADEEKEGEVHLKERRFAKVRRSFSVPPTVDAASVEASLENGVLHLVLQKREDVLPRRIDIN